MGKKDWDIEDCRTKFESDEHWNLKKEFLLAHKDKIEKNRLICLASVFVNVQLMRCKYPDPVMRQVAELSKGIGVDYKTKQKERLQRTFVKASDAASAKVKKLNLNYSKATCETKTKSGNNVEVSEDKTLIASKNKTKHPQIIWDNVQEGASESKTLNDSKNKRKRPQVDCDLVPDDITKKTPKKNKIEKIKNKYAEALKTDSNPSLYKTDSSPSLGSYVSPKVASLMNKIEKEKLVVSETKRIPDQDARQVAEYSQGIQCIDIDYKTKQTETLQEKSFSDNIGAKMLKLMGWTGGGLGKNEDGIIEPISICFIHKREGIGLSESKLSNVQISRKRKNLLKTSLPAEVCDQNNLYTSNVFLVFRSYNKDRDLGSFLKSSLEYSNLVLGGNYNNNTFLLFAKLNGRTLQFGEGKGRKKNIARNQALEIALPNLLQKCYTLEIKKEFGGVSEISMDFLNEGILDSANISQNENDPGPAFKSKVKVILDDMKNKIMFISQADHLLEDIIFPPGLSNVQRKYIYLLVRDHYKIMVCKNRGNVNKRFHVIKPKEYNTKILIHKLLSEGGITDNYTVHKPGTLYANYLFS